ncbi:MAG: hypothetical protein JWP82_908 [Humibacillus sp.]|nr:hypothetical protein [Humibacillus sp.]
MPQTAGRTAAAPRTAAGAVRIRTARLAAHDDLAGVVRGLTLDALEPPVYAALPSLVLVETTPARIAVTLREPLASFAQAHGCREVAAHGEVLDGVRVATVVLTRHPEPVGR